MTDTLVVLNAGSSSIKFQMLERDGLAVLGEGKVVRIGASPRLEARFEGVAPITQDLAEGANHEAALAAVLELATRHADGRRIAAFVHRVVHGGARHVAPVIVTPDVLASLEQLVPLAPLHQPHSLAGIRACMRLAADAPNVACFDTAFHAGRSELAASYALPRELRQKGIRRYGFHGISYQWIARVLAEDHPALRDARVVVAHLGNGASLCAMREGRSVDTTMGMTALDGLPMGTRPGAIDPGVLLYMMRELGMDAAEVEHALYHRSGLLGLSGISNDVATLLASDAPEAKFALDYLTLRCAQQIAAMAASLGGIDALVFTGGIGEHAAPLREAVVQRARFLGDFSVLVIPANEERMMAVEALALLGRVS
ncbi:MAG: acetate/propionate family kinase [Rhizobiaceae bacterium]